MAFSARVGDIEARVAAFKNEQKEMRDKKVDAMRAEVKAAQDRLTSSVQEKGDEIASAWDEFNQSMKAKADAVRSTIESKKDAIDAKRAEDRADRLELNAAHAVSFALLAIEDAELAVAEAIDARIHSDSLTQSGTDWAGADLKAGAELLLERETITPDDFPPLQPTPERFAEAAE